MKESICEMEKLFDEAYHNLPLLGDELRREKFLKLYNQFNDINGAYFSAQKQSGDLFEKAFQINLDFTLLCSMYDTRFAHVKRAREQEKIDEKGKASQSMDGSCWLHTIINALPYLTFSEGIEYDVSSTASLREAVVNWMETHRENPELLEHLERAIFDHKEHMTDYAKAYIEELKMMHQSGDCSDEQFEENELRATTDISNLENFSLDDYFRLMREPNSFGSGAEFYALSQMLKINIRILVDNGTEVPESDRFPDLNYPGATQTAYVLMNPSGNHFDRYHPTEDVTISGLLDIRAAHDIPSPSASSSSSSSSS